MVNQVKELLLILKEANVKLWVQDGQLQSKAPKGAITPELREKIKQYRDDIIALLEAGAKNTSAEALMGIPQVPQQAYYALSNAQRRLWILTQMNATREGLAAYNMPMCIRLRGLLQVDALSQAFTLLKSRHEVLRTRFVAIEGEGRQVIDPAPSPAQLVVENLNLGQSPAYLIHHHAQKVFDLENEHLLEVKLVKMEDEEHLLLFNMHHIISDGWSMGVLVRELSVLYQACSAAHNAPLSLLPELPVQYKDYSAWQNALLQDEVAMSTLRKYWLNQLQQLPTLDLPLDAPRPALMSYRGAYQQHLFSPELSRALQLLADERGSTLFMVLVALLKVLLHRYTRQTDIVIGTPIAGRTHPDLYNQIGFYVNTLVLRNQLNPEHSFEALLQQVKQNVLGAFKHEQYPFDRLVEDLNIPRDMSRSAIFDVMLVLQNNEKTQLQLGDLKVLHEEIETATSKFDLNFAFGESPEGLILQLEYNSDIFTTERIERMIGHFESLMESAIAEPGQLIGRMNMLKAAERQLVLHGFNDNATVFPPYHNIVESFEKTAAQYPDDIAIVAGKKQISYRELNETTNQIAHYLREQFSVQPDDIFALLMERSEWTVITIIGVLKSGAAYLPLATDIPAARAQYILEESNAKALLTDAQSYARAQQLLEQGSVLPVIDLSAIPANDSLHNPLTINSVQDLAYIIYTSGTTGKPKGVAMIQKGLINMVQWQVATCATGRGSRTTLFAPYTFDISLQEIFATYDVGGTLIILPDDIREQFNLLPLLLKEHQVNRLYLPFVALQQLAELVYDDPQQLSSLQVITTAGEQLQSSKALRHLFQSIPHCVLKNHYGPTEAHVVTEYVMPDDPANWMDLPPVGKPISNLQLFIVDQYFQPVPPGVPGEILVAGDGLARGYLNRPEITQQLFIPHPFKSPESGERVYRTGDLAMWLTGGNIEFLGRIDQQLKIRGYRIETGEIEQVLLGHESIQACIVMGRDINGIKELVAYLVPQPGAEVPDVNHLRSFLGAQLPEYMLPSYFIAMEAFPLAAGSKVDRKALPLPDASAIHTGTKYEAPRNEAEWKMASIWEAVLDRSPIGVFDNFFSLGGHSLRALKVLALVRQAFGVDVRLSEIFSRPTIAAFAELLEPQAHLQDLLKQPIPRVPEQNNYALSNAQQRLWVLSQLQESTEAAIAYNMPVAIRLKGQLQVAVLEKVLTALCERHEVLRTRFVSIEGEGRQVIDAAPENFVLDCLDVLESELAAHIQAHAAHVFELAREHSFQVQLLRLAADQHVMLLNMHHIISDGWSLNVLVQEMSQLYRAYEEGHADPLGQLPALSIQYKDYANWQNERLNQEGEAASLRNYWHQNLQNLPSWELPMDHPRPAVKTYNGTRLYRKFSAETTQELKALAESNGATLFMTLLALVKVLFYRYTQQSDILIGTPTAGRMHPDLHHQIGFYLNTLVLRNQIDGKASFSTFLQQVKGTTLAAFEHELYPFDRLVEELNIPRDLSRSPLFDVMVILQNNERSDLSLGALEISFEDLELAVSKYDLSITFSEGVDDLDLIVNYNTDLFETSRMERLYTHLEYLMEQALADPNTAINQLDILPLAERKQLLNTFNNNYLNLNTNQTLTQLFEAQVAKTPDQIALVFEDQVLSYQELNERANQLAHYLRNTYQLKADDIVALQLERSEWMVIAILGVLKSGAAYLPIAPDAPLARVEFMLQDSRSKVLFGDRHTQSSTVALASLLPLETIESCTCFQPGAPNKLANPSPINHSHNLSYIIYTSGSTGQPKGVLAEHRSVVNFLLGFTEQIFKLYPSEQLHTALTATYTFDGSVRLMMGSLINGFRLHVVPEAIKLNAEAIQQYLEQHQIHLIDGTPTLLSLWLNNGLQRSEGIALKNILLSGEALSPALLRQFFEQFAGYPVQVTNLYGPTETTMVATHWIINAAEASDVNSFIVGKPLPNYEIYILNPEQLMLQPIGTYGEVFIGGKGLSRGYLNNPELTDAKFIPHPFKPGERIYRTGDMARWRADGMLEFSGRIDTQLKIRGYRIEAGEVEQALLIHEAIQSCAVAGVAIDGVTELVAYLVPKSGSELPDVDALRSFLEATLPDYMIPGYYVELAQLPLTASGKTNRKALPTPDLSAVQPVANYTAPRNALEEQLVHLWEEVLDRQPIGVSTNFFSLGGHSLRAIRLRSLIKQALGVDLRLSEIFTHPTIEGLAKCIDKIPAGKAFSLQSVPRVSLQPHYALSHAQHRLWVLDQMNQSQEARTAYNMPGAIQLTGYLDLHALNQALSLLRIRHETLRTRFINHNGEGRQVIDLPGMGFELAYEDHPGVDIHAAIKAHASRIFDLSKEHLLRIKLIRVSELEHYLLFNMHHIISDGWSMGVLVQEFGQLYQACGQKLPQPLGILPQLLVQYKDYAAWQNTLLEQEQTIEPLRSYWKSQLENLPTLELPTDYARPAIKTYQGQRLYTAFSIETSQALQALADRNEATLYMVLTAAIKVLLYRYTRQNDLVIGSPIAGRNHPDLHHQIGFFVNTLVLRNQLDGAASFEQLLSQVKQTALDAFEHELYPFDRLVEDLELPRDLSRAPIFDVMLVLQNHEKSELNLGELQISTVIPEVTTSKFDLLFNFVQFDGQLNLQLEYSTDLFKAERMERMLSHLNCLLQEIVGNATNSLDQLNILPVEERQQVLLDFNRFDRAYPEVHNLAAFFEAQVAKTPDQIALIDGFRQLTYRELNEQANKLAYYLRQTYAVQPDDIVGLLMERSAWTVISILGVLKSSAAYLPLAVDLPASRMLYMMENSRAKVLLSDAKSFSLAQSLGSEQDAFGIASVEAIPGQWPVDNPENLNQPQDLAYIIYTSGTTGHPKGVAMIHRGICNLIQWQSAHCRVGTGDRTSMFSPYTFDISIQEIFTTYDTGGTLVVLPHDIREQFTALPDMLQKNQINRLFLPFVALQQLSELVYEHPAQLASLREIITAGEQLQSSVALRHLLRALPHCVLKNQYGPTEAHVVSEYVMAENPDEWMALPPVGKPIDNLKLYIVDQHLQPVPIGIPGEVLVAGVGLARGYIHQDEITARFFRANPFVAIDGSERMYKTGDLARWLPDGSIECLGRLDQQLKVRGYRVEVGEIEKVLSEHNAIQSCVVVGHDFQGVKELVAYWIPQPGIAAPDVPSLRKFLGAQLPDYMIPSHFVLMERFPLSAGSKVNRKALPIPEKSAHQASADFVAPRTSLETSLAKVWLRVLDRAEIGVLDNFFSLGGHSLRAIRLCAEINTELGYSLPLRAIFQHPTIAELAAKLEEFDHLLHAEGLTYNPGAAHMVFAFPPFYGLAMAYEPFAARTPEISWYCFDFLENNDRLELYYQQIKAQQPQGPYCLFGYSAGGVLAYEMARYLEQKGEIVSDVIFGDSAIRLETWDFDLSAYLADAAADAADYPELAQHLDLLQNELYFKQTESRMTKYHYFLNELDTIPAIQANIHQLLAERLDEASNPEYLKVNRNWSACTQGQFKTYAAQGKHDIMFEHPYLESNMALLNSILDEAFERHESLDSALSTQQFA